MTISHSYIVVNAANRLSVRVIACYGISNRFFSFLFSGLGLGTCTMDDMNCKQLLVCRYCMALQV